ncbi:T9SS-dependent choice-of-anchor J family protein [Chryseobacterium herbae]|uniref:Choice-of-anchor J domain-containing protein n=1 Tax=Chryseobacterium herbae TaxID=2976476 RepID=A0ABT2IZH3_9FLAO|nr:choice-of-anchor J domain-containing protein [Chryseobacterium sp. pc1-10]MCT2564258.1 choice-of-anchor J domain-containing protein [Chryseobacterium sp. pc1-10]
MKKTFLIFTLVGAFLPLSAQTTIFEETFTTSLGIPTGWEVLDRDSDGKKWLVDDISDLVEGYPGDAAYIFSGQDTSSTDNVLVTPTINVPGGNPSSLTFSVQAYVDQDFFTATQNHYAVYVLPAASSFTGAETPVLDENITAGTTTVSKTVNLSSYAGQAVKIYFRQFMNTTLEGYIMILDTVKVTQSSPLGISEVTSGFGTEIFPNPASDYLYLKSSMKITDLEIFDFSGKKLNAPYKGNKVDIRKFQSGTYIIVLTCGDKKYTQRFIKN